ncbi:MAG: dihydroorotase [Clostridiales bacterium]|nr:MAG: dihydroorotase [Clostridiales bacterium]
MKLLIAQGNLVDPARKYDGSQDILIENGVIAAIAPKLDAPEAQRIDGRGLSVSPGLIDPHVHLRDPGLTYKEDILTGTAAAACGGFTAVACMPNTKPVADCPEIIAGILDRAQSGSGVRVLPIGAISVGERGERCADFAALKMAGAVALSDDGVPVMRAVLMREALQRAKDCGLPLLCHEEDGEMVRNYAVNEGKISRQLGIPGRPAIAEELMVARDGLLSLETGVPVHFCHISTAGSVNIIRRLKAVGAAVTCETCPQYFTLTEDAILERGSLARVNPPLRTAADVAAIVEGLRDGTIDCIATDHAPHAAEEKARPLTEAPSGMVGLETALAITLTQLYHSGAMELTEILQKMTAGPAQLLNLPYGKLAVGAVADLTLFDLNEKWTIDPVNFRSKGRNTPFARWSVQGKAKYTLVGGRVIYRDQ